MSLEKIREHCLSLPSVTEEVMWGNDLVFKIGGKMFAVISLDEGPANHFSFKCAPEEFAELTERAGIIPAPYMARHHWVAVEKSEALSQAETKRLIRDSYEMVKAKLPKKVLAEIEGQLNKSPAKTQKAQRPTQKAQKGKGK